MYKIDLNSNGTISYREKIRLERRVFVSAFNILNNREDNMNMDINYIEEIMKLDCDRSRELVEFYEKLQTITMDSVNSD